MKAVLTGMLGLGSVCAAQTGNDQDLGAVLTRGHANQTLILRHAIQDDRPTYDSTGRLLSGGEDEPWILYGGLKPTAITITTQELRIEGDRLAFESRGWRNSLSSRKTGKHLQVAIKLSEPLLSLEQAEAVLHRVFAVSNDELVECVPDFWKPYLSSHALLVKAPGFAKARPEAQVPAQPHAYNVGNRVTSPQPIFTPEPNYRQAVKKYQHEGTVVLSAVIDETGKIDNPVIQRPAGMGLDEKAIEVVRTWRFKPGRLDGKPVPVEMNLEIAFHLYD